MMKYLLVTLVLFVAFQIWRSKRRQAARPPKQAPAHLKQPEPMVCCAHCGTHLPASDAIVDAEQKTYCNAQHRALGPL